MVEAWEKLVHFYTTPTNIIRVEIRGTATLTITGHGDFRYVAVDPNGDLAQGPFGQIKKLKALHYMIPH